MEWPLLGTHYSTAACVYPNILHTLLKLFSHYYWIRQRILCHNLSTFSSVFVIYGNYTSAHKSAASERKKVAKPEKKKGREFASFAWSPTPTLSFWGEDIFIGRQTVSVDNFGHRLDIAPKSCADGLGAETELRSVACTFAPTRPQSQTFRDKFPLHKMSALIPRRMPSLFRLVGLALARYSSKDGKKQIFIAFCAIINELAL